MKSQRAIGIDLSWSTVTPVLAINVALLVAASRWPVGPPADTRIWWSVVTLAVIIAILGTVTVRRKILSALLSTWLFGRFARVEAIDAHQFAAVDHHRRFGRNGVGVRAHRDQLLSVAAVNASAERETLSIGAVASSLFQFDVRLSSADIVTVTRGRQDGSPPRTWLIVRMNQSMNFGAIAARDCVASLCSAVTERLSDLMTSRHCTVLPLTIDEISEVERDLLIEWNPNEIQHRCGTLKRRTADEEVDSASSWWISPHDIHYATFDALLSNATAPTVTVIRLEPAAGQTVVVSALVRKHRAADSDNKPAGLNRAYGQQLAALKATLPVPVKLSLDIARRPLAADEELLLPLMPSSRRSFDPEGAGR